MSSLLNDILTKFQLLHQEILDLYQPKEDPVEKWTKIATLMHDKRELINEIFSVIKKQPDRKEIEIDYELDFDKLQSRIKSEADLLIKSSLIISSLHVMVYDMLTTEGNYYFTLNGQEEMQVLKKDIIYYINLSVKVEQNLYFHAFILLYALESLFNRHFYVGIDFEYTNKKIQLAQLNFEHSVVLQSIIMMVSPNELEPVMTEDFIKLIICNKYIKKILHGSDSLDIPYMYEHLLNGDPNKIIRFTRTLIDTRFLCEYYRLNRNELDGKCSIYDENKDGSAIYYFGVISEEQQNKLAELLDSMPADIVWNIHKMKKSQVLYAQYDVIYLKYFYYRIIYVATLDEKTDLGKKMIIELYKHVLGELTQFVYLEKRNITSVTAKCKEEVDPINNYMIRKPTGIFKLIDIYNMVSVGLVTADPKVELDKVMKVNYYKALLTVMTKKMTYTIVSQRCKVYKDRSTVWADRLDNKYVFDFLEHMGFYYLKKVFKDIERTLDVRILALCRG